MILTAILKLVIGGDKADETILFDHNNDRGRFPLKVYAENGTARKIEIDKPDELIKGVTVYRNEMLGYVYSAVGDKDNYSLHLDDNIDELGRSLFDGVVDIISCEEITFDMDPDKVNLIGDFKRVSRGNDIPKKDDFCYMVGLIYGLNCYYDQNSPTCLKQTDCNTDSMMMVSSYEYQRKVENYKDYDPKKDFVPETYQAAACNTVNCYSTWPLNNGCASEMIVILASSYWWYWTVPAIFSVFLLVAVIVWCTGFCCMALYSNPEQRSARQYKYIYKKKKKDKKDKKVIHIHVNANPETKNNDVTYAPNKSTSSSSSDDNVQKNQV